MNFSKVVASLILMLKYLETMIWILRPVKIWRSEGSRGFNSTYDTSDSNIGKNMKNISNIINLTKSQKSDPTKFINSRLTTS